jgi:prevent-host-death family protein
VNNIDLVTDLVYNCRNAHGRWEAPDMQKMVNIHEAKTHLSRLLTLVMAGEEVIIAKAGKPVARLVPIGERPKARKPGSASGQITIASDLEAPLPDEILKGFEG